MPIMTPQRAKIIQHVLAGGENPGSHRSAAYLKWRKNLAMEDKILKDSYKMDARNAKLKAKTDLMSNYVRENPEAELRRLQNSGYVKGSAYKLGFMLKIAESLDRTKTTSTLKPSILYNKHSMMIRMKKGAQMSQTFMDLRPQPNKQAQGPSNGDPNPAPQPYRKKSKMEKYLGRK